MHALWVLLENAPVHYIRQHHPRYRSSSFGWNPQQKKTEMFDPLSRFVIARDISDPANDLPSSGVIAYSIFRFEREDRQNVIYW